MSWHDSWGAKVTIANDGHTFLEHRSCPRWNVLVMCILSAIHRTNRKYTACMNANVGTNKHHYRALYGHLSPASIATVVYLSTFSLYCTAVPVPMYLYRYRYSQNSQRPEVGLLPCRNYLTLGSDTFGRTVYKAPRQRSTAPWVIFNIPPVLYYPSALPYIYSFF